MEGIWGLEFMRDRPHEVLWYPERERDGTRVGTDWRTWTRKEVGEAHPGQRDLRDREKARQVKQATPVDPVVHVTKELSSSGRVCVHFYRTGITWARAFVYGTASPLQRREGKPHTLPLLWVEEVPWGGLGPQAFSVASGLADWTGLLAPQLQSVLRLRPCLRMLPFVLDTLYSLKY